MSAVELIKPRVGRFVDFPEGRFVTPLAGWTIEAAIEAATAYADEHATAEIDHARHLGAAYRSLTARMSANERRREVRLRLQRSGVVASIDWSVITAPSTERDSAPF